MKDFISLTEKKNPLPLPQTNWSTLAHRFHLLESLIREWSRRYCAGRTSVSTNSVQTGMQDLPFLEGLKRFAVMCYFGLVDLCPFWAYFDKLYLFILIMCFRGFFLHNIEFHPSLLVCALVALIHEFNCSDLSCQKFLSSLLQEAGSAILYCELVPRLQFYKPFSGSRSH